MYRIAIGEISHETNTFSNVPTDRAQFEAAMSSLPPRTFLMRNVHDDAPVLLRTRWALSYLRGPLTTAEISRLDAAAGPAQPSSHAPATVASAVGGSGDRIRADATSATPCALVSW